MRRALVAVVVAWTCSSAVGASAHSTATSTSTATKPTDAEVRKRMIEESIAAYSGPCPCPYNTARNGSRCGKRSAYSRPGGAAPLCYPTDITDAMVREYRAAHAAN